MTQMMQKKNPDWKFEPKFARIVSTTTRQPRKNEVNGVDYFFISEDVSRQLEAHGEFAELVDFRGVRYGVTTAEMEKKMNGNLPSAIVLEPNGLRQYEVLCTTHGWGIFKIYVHTIESLRIDRLNARTAVDIWNAVSNVNTEDQGAPMLKAKAVEKQLKIHTDRMLSITCDERRWQNMSSWDAIIPGDDIHKAVRDIAFGINWRNYRNSQ